MRELSTSRHGYFGKGSVEVAPPEREGEGGIRRSALSPDKMLEVPAEGVETVYDVLQYAARTHGERNALGWRDVLNIHQEEKMVKKVVDGKSVEEKKKWSYFELSEYKYMTYIQLLEKVNHVAAGFLEIGLERDQVFNVFAQTSPNWQVIANACAAIANPIATAYATLGEEGLTHSLNEPECVGLFTNADLLPTLYKVLANTPTVKFVIYDGKPSDKLVKDVNNVREEVKIYHIDELAEIGKKSGKELPHSRKPTKDDISCIMYTSGTTGAPKGVLIAHSNVVASVGATKAMLSHHITPDDSYLAFLPLAHVLEYVVETFMIYMGCPMGYANIKTLTDTSVRKCKGDIAEFKPTIMVGVPAVWDTIRKGIYTKINSSGAMSKHAFNMAYEIRKRGIPVLSSLMDKLVMANIRAATGGRLRIGVSGGAALSKETHEFLDLTMLSVIPGYGMTEASGICAIVPPELASYGATGLPVPCIEVKLIDHAEAGYSSKNDPPTGEVCFRGPSVTKGYYKRPDLTKEAFMEDGWVKTGDIAQWNPDGTLAIIDRIKNLVKLSGGEYVALEKLESTFKAGVLIGNLCVHAAQGSKAVIAIIIPHEANLRHALEGQNDITEKGKSLQELCADEKVKAFVQAQCNALGKKNGFKPMEMLGGVVLTTDEWTPENGMVTAAQKIQRKKIADAYKKEIDEVYKGIDGR